MTDTGVRVTTATIPAETQGLLDKAGRFRAMRAEHEALTENGDLTHDGLALQLGEEWTGARHVAAWGKWLFFDGVAWCFDETLEHMTRARAFLRKLADNLPFDLKSKARTLRQADTVAKVVGLARSNPIQAAGVGQWDADDWLLGTPGGTVDLRTGIVRPARETDYITKTTAVAPAAPGTAARLFAEFLARITDQNDDLQKYLQRFFGYSLTGSIREHVFGFGHGGGANGKTVLLNVVTGILGDYAVSIPTEMLMVSQSDRHPTELARLRGVRLAVGSETEHGKRWAEARIKSLTGGDPIAARFMRQDFFEFKPTFKLVVVGNHRPSLSGVDEAMRRRLHLIPFGVTIPANERDPQLSEKLRSEWPAILRWMIDGCLSWQLAGLQPPARVQAATAEYLEAEDALTQWLSDCCELRAEAWEPSGSLFAAWKQWAERAGEFAGSQKRFTQQLLGRGFVSERSGSMGIRGIRGISLLQAKSV